jgi:hypothetical protein
VRRGQQEGLIDAALDVQQCVEDVVAPFLYRRLVTQARITARQVDSLLSELLRRWSPR